MDLQMKMVMLVITYRCNLKCRLCTSGSPYFDVPPHYTLKDLKPVISRIFELSSHVTQITTSGGETFLHPELPQIIDFVTQFTNQYDRQELITNATIIPNDEIIDSCKRSGKIVVLVDDYGPKLSTNREAVVKKLNDAGITYRVRKYYGDDAYCGGWVDLRDLSKKLFNQQDTDKRFGECIYPRNFNFCFPISDGIMHPCGVARRCYMENAVPHDELQYVDLMSEVTTLEQKREQIRALQNTKTLKACAYCNGFSADSPRFLPAEQL
jgi:MoaA/NifB/PqqE/SkfB family radical SAM enzyme